MPIDMDMNDFITSNYYNSTNVPDGVILEEIIINVVRKEFEENGVAETKAVVRLHSGKALVLNQTRLTALVGAYGPNPNNWLGRTVLIKRGMTHYQGRPVACVDVQPIVPPRIEGESAPASIAGPKSSPSGAAATPSTEQAPAAELAPPAPVRRMTVTSGRSRRGTGADVYADLAKRRPDLKQDLKDEINDEIPF